MNGEIHPLTAAMVNWSSLIDQMAWFGKASPLRKLDNQGIDPRDPAAMAVVMDFSPEILRMIDITFVARVTTDEALILPNTLRTTILARKSFWILLLLQGSLIDWKLAIIEGCDTELRWLFNSAYSSLRNTNFRPLFDGYNVVDCPDGGFRLV